MIICTRFTNGLSIPLTAQKRASRGSQSAISFAARHLASPLSQDISKTLKIKFSRIAILFYSIPEALALPTSTTPSSTPSKDLRLPLLEKAHLAGHFGWNALYNSIRLQQLNWPNLASDCQEVTKSCTSCQRFVLTRKGYHPITPIHATLPFDHVAIDLIGPLPTSRLGYNYILVHVDVLTRFVLIRPLTDKTALTVARTLFTIWADFGFPRILQSDNGTEFVNSVLQALAKSAMIDHRLISPYHPRANGLAERYVQTTKNTLKKLLNADTSEWEIHLPAIRFFMNNKVAAIHGSTPFSVMFARRANQDFTNDGITPPPDTAKLRLRMQHIQDVLFPAVSDKLAASQLKLKRRFNSNYPTATNPFPVGSYVMRLDPTKKSALQTADEGPFKVLKRSQGGAYLLQDQTGALLPRNVPPFQLKIISYHADPSEQSFEVHSILNHCGSTQEREYLVKWKHDHPDAWIHHAKFNDLEIIRKYWARRTGHDVLQRSDLL